MGGTIRFRYEGDASSAIEEFKRLDRIQKKLESQTGRVAKVSVDAAGRTNVALGKQLSAIKKVSTATGTMGRAYKSAGAAGTAAMTKVRSTLVGGAGIALAVSTVRKAYGEWEADIDRLSQKSTDFAQKLVRDITQAGDTLKGAAIEKLVGGLPGVPREKGRAAFAGVRAGAPGASFERAAGLTKSVAQLALAGEDVEKLGQLTGSLNKLARGKSAGDVTDLALAVRQAAGRDIDKVIGPRALKGVGGLTATGAAGLEEALALTTSAARSDLPPTFTGQLAESVNKQLALTDKSSAAARTFQGAGAKERLRLLLTDQATQGVPGLLQQSTALGLKQLNQADVAALTTQFRQAQTGDLAQRTVADVGNFPAGRQLQSSIRQEAARDKLEAQGEGKAFVLKQANELFSDVQRATGRFDGVFNLIEGKLDSSTAFFREEADVATGTPRVKARLRGVSNLISEGLSEAELTRSQAAGFRQQLADLKQLANAAKDTKESATSMKDAAAEMRAVAEILRDAAKQREKQARDLQPAGQR